jgi:hypothetical protein
VEGISDRVRRSHKGASAVTYEPIIRYAPIIVPLILMAGVAFVTVYHPLQISKAPGIADAATSGCVGVGSECRR